MRARRLLLAVFLMAALLPGPGRAGTRLAALALSQEEGATHLSFELPAGAGHRLFTLEHPDRVVLDLTGAASPSEAVPPPVGLVRSVRIAPHSATVLRIVLELARPATPHATRVALADGRARLELVISGTAAAPPRVRELAPEPTRALVVAVDAGHGGDDPGAIGRRGTREKDVTLAVAKALAARIDREPGMRAVLTRDGDYFVKLFDRIQKARDDHADLFVSVHADAVGDRSVSGASVYVLSTHGASSVQARMLAEHENAADLLAGPAFKDKDPVLRTVLLDVAQTQAMSSSRLAAQRVLHALDEVGDVRHSAIQAAGFAVLKSPGIPSMLVETAYITNPDEERELGSSAYQTRLAEAILAGLRSYFHDYPPLDTRLVAQGDSEHTARLR
jgi:N-acetylmuramoyl-L-alanine amidase